MRWLVACWVAVAGCQPSGSHQSPMPIASARISAPERRLEGERVSSSASNAGNQARVEPATQCEPGHYTYLGFTGDGPPPAELVARTRERFPDAVVVIVEDGKLGLITHDGYGVESRKKHEAAGDALGWKGDTVDFPSVTERCELSLPRPVPPPPNP